MANSSGVIVIIGLAVVAFTAWKIISAKLNDYYDRRRQRLLVERLTSNFPDCTDDVRRLDANGIFQAMLRRDEDFNRAWTKDVDERVAREKSSGPQDDDWKAPEADDWPRASYFRPFLSEEFCNRLDHDVATWRSFFVCVQNAQFEGGFAKERLWVGEDGRIKFKSLESIQ